MLTPIRSLILGTAVFSNAAAATPLTAEQKNVCGVYARLGRQMAEDRDRAYTYQQQVDRFRARMGDDSMTTVKAMLDFVYSGALKGSSPAEYERAFFNICEIQHQPPK